MSQVTETPVADDVVAAFKVIGQIATTWRDNLSQQMVEGMRAASSKRDS